MSRENLRELQHLLASRSAAQETLRTAKEALAHIELEIIQTRREDASLRLRNLSQEATWALDFSDEGQKVVLTPWVLSEDGQKALILFAQDLGILMKGSSQHFFDQSGRVGRRGGPPLRDPKGLPPDIHQRARNPRRGPLPHGGEDRPKGGSPSRERSGRSVSSSSRCPKRSSGKLPGP